jgi:hypothetical protein
MLSGSDTERHFVLALDTIQNSFWNLELAMRARSQSFWWVLSLNWLSCDTLNLLLELWIYLIDVFWSHQYDGLSISSLF